MKDFKKTDPAYINVQIITEASIERWLDGMTEEEKKDRGFLVFTSSIPATQEEIEGCVDNFIRLFDTKTPEEEEELKAEVCERIEQRAFDVDVSLPIEAFISDVKSKLLALPKEDLLNMGVFGPMISEEDAKWAKASQISGLLLIIDEAGAREASGSGTNPEDEIPERNRILNQFRKEIQLFKEYYIEAVLRNARMYN